MRSRSTRLLLIAAFVIPSILFAQSRRIMGKREAATLLQGTDTVPFLGQARVEEVADLLSRVRAQFPEVADIEAGPDLARLRIGIADSVLPRLLRTAGDTVDGFTRVSTTKVRGIDSLNRAFRAREVRAYYIGPDLIMFEIVYSRWPNIPVLEQAYERLPQVESAGFPLYVGDGSFIRLIRKADWDYLVFVRGGGDCPAGCTERDYYYIAHDRQARRLTKVRQWLHTDTLSGRTPQVFLWDFPTRHSFMMYPTVDSLLAGATSKQWWLRQHALDVLLYMLGPNTGPWHGAREQDPKRFRELQAALRRPWKRSSGVLMEALGDPDADIQALVRDGLEKLYHNDFGVGVSAQRRWQAWLARQPD